MGMSGLQLNVNESTDLALVTGLSIHADDAATDEVNLASSLGLDLLIDHPG